MNFTVREVKSNDLDYAGDDAIIELNGTVTQRYICFDKFCKTDARCALTLRQINIFHWPMYDASYSLIVQSTPKQSYY